MNQHHRITDMTTIVVMIIIVVAIVVAINLEVPGLLDIQRTLPDIVLQTIVKIIIFYDKILKFLFSILKFRFK